jgi:hypothetical protein
VCIVANKFSGSEVRLNSNNASSACLVFLAYKEGKFRLRNSVNSLDGHQYV